MVKDMFVFILRLYFELQMLEVVFLMSEVSCSCFCVPMLHLNQSLFLQPILPTYNETKSINNTNNLYLKHSLAPGLFRYISYHPTLILFHHDPHTVRLSQGRSTNHKLDRLSTTDDSRATTTSISQSTEYFDYHVDQLAALQI